MTEIEIYKAALAKWTVSLQIIVAIEELAELSRELARFLRFGMDPEQVTCFGPIADEIADVQIMLDQIKIAFPLVDHTKVKKIKLSRLEQLLNS